MKPVTFLEALQFARSRKIVLPDEFYSGSQDTTTGHHGQFYRA